jgi:tetratricopeptide (TPR) repeat protein
MINELKEKKKVMKTNTYESLKALYYSGKVKPTLNKIVAELKDDSENLELILLACQCLERAKDIEELSSYADLSIKLAPEVAEGYYYKGVALQHNKGKEQDALKNFNQALTLDPENPIFLKSKASTHFLLYTDYHLPLQLAEKHRAKTEACLLKVIEVIEKKENPNYIDYFIIGDVFVQFSKAIHAKKYFFKAINAYNASDASEQNKNIYKDIVKAQNACKKLMDKVTDD